MSSINKEAPVGSDPEMATDEFFVTRYTMLDTEHTDIFAFERAISLAKESRDDSRDYPVSAMPASTLIKIRAGRKRYNIVKMVVNEKKAASGMVFLSGIKSAEPIKIFE